MPEEARTPSANVKVLVVARQVPEDWERPNRFSVELHVPDFGIKLVETQCGQECAVKPLDAVDDTIRMERGGSLRLLHETDLPREAVESARALLEAKDTFAQHEQQVSIAFRL